MTHVIVMPVWELLLLMVAVSIVTSIPTSYFAAKRGGRNAITWCSQHNDCYMRISEKNASNTADMEAQLAALRKAHPEIAAVREAMDKVDTGTHRVRAQQDIDNDGHKG